MFRGINSTTCPSTAKQKLLGAALVEKEKFTLPKLRFKAWTGIFEKNGNKILLMRLIIMLWYLAVAVAVVLPM